tara:strand:- start:520 stop:852 length:333 start_codon:yes stop_codon:yes gene_type:complete
VKKLISVKYSNAILTLMFSSFLTVLMLLYVGNITRKIEKKNSLLKEKIEFIQEQVNVNEIEYTFYNSYNYLKKLQRIYLEDTNINFTNQRVSYKYFEKKNLDIFHTVGTK